MIVVAGLGAARVHQCPRSATDARVFCFPATSTSRTRPNSFLRFSRLARLSPSPGGAFNLHTFVLSVFVVPRAVDRTRVLCQLIIKRLRVRAAPKLLPSLLSGSLVMMASRAVKIALLVATIAFCGAWGFQGGGRGKRGRRYRACTLCVTRRASGSSSLDDPFAPSSPPLTPPTLHHNTQPPASPTPARSSRTPRRSRSRRRRPRPPAATPPRGRRPRPSRRASAAATLR